MVKNCKGWIQIVEAFVAILMIVGVLLIVIKNQNGEEDISERVYNAEISIIREIQVNDALRDEIVNLFDNYNTTITWENVSFPANVKTLITTRTPNYLTCVGEICNTIDPCYLTSYSEKDTYAQPGIISGTKNDYNPAQLKLFCWAK